MSNIFTETEGAAAGGDLIDIVVVNWNAGRQLHACLQSIGEHAPLRETHVIIVDNASSDGSTILPDGPNLSLSMVLNRRNRGFGAACNQGSRAGQAPFILFLNPDARLTAGCIERLIGQFLADDLPEVGVVGPRLIDEGGKLSRHCARVPRARDMLGQVIGLDRLFPKLFRPHFMTDWEHRQTRDVGQVMGAALMIRRDVFERLNGFDERFFMYFEDLDLCVRAARDNFRVVYCAEAAAVHVGGVSSEQARDRRLSRFQTSLVSYAFKHHGLGVASLAAAGILFIQLPVRFIAALRPSGASRPSDVVKGAFQFLSTLFHSTRRRLLTGTARSVPEPQTAASRRDSSAGITN